MWTDGHYLMEVFILWDWMYTDWTGRSFNRRSGAVFQTEKNRGSIAGAVDRLPMVCPDLSGNRMHCVWVLWSGV